MFKLARILSRVLRENYGIAEKTLGSRLEINTISEELDVWFSDLTAQASCGDVVENQVDKLFITLVHSSILPVIASY